MYDSFSFGIDQGFLKRVRVLVTYSADESAVLESSDWKVSYDISFASIADQLLLVDEKDLAGKLRNFSCQALKARI